MTWDAAWTGVLIVEDEKSTDGRMLVPGALRWERGKVYPLTNYRGEVVGTVDNIWRDRNEVKGLGRAKFPLGTLSDPDSDLKVGLAVEMKIEKYEILNSDGDAAALGEILQDEDALIRVTEGILLEVAATTTPAFPAARIERIEEIADGDHTAGTSEHNRRTDWVGITEEGAERLRAHNDIPHPSGGDRLAIYAVVWKPVTMTTERRRLAETSIAGLGSCLLTLQDEGEFEGYRVGVFDRETRTWLISPWAGTSPWIPTGDD